MALKITNTLSGKKEDFKPLKKGEVKFYQCGPTVYWVQHIGNMRAAVLADMMRRTFEYLDMKVDFVRNYTDVGHLTSDGDEGEDRMEKGARREGLSPLEIAEKYIKVFENDTGKLNVLEPDAKPRATEMIPEILEMVQNLLDKGYAYQTSSAIYFDTSKAKDYSRLSKQEMEDKKEGVREEVVVDKEKKNPSDFALWFFRKGKHANALQFWQSPWGDGFPGWHIECSAMNKKFLGNTIDVHMGGIEHIPVHHTNEIAQSESANGAPFVDYWVHNGHLLANNGKMSKSAGTSYCLDDVEKKGFNPLALRYFFMQAHYRQNQNFTWEAMSSAQSGFNNLKKQIKDLGKSPGAISDKYQKKFEDAISDDFNFPQALAIAFETLKSELALEDKLATILDMDKVFGLGLKNLPEEKIPEEVTKLAEARAEARKAGNWAMADEIRGKIEALGYEIKDAGDGYKLGKK